MTFHNLKGGGPLPTWARRMTLRGSVAHREKQKGAEYQERRGEALGALLAVTKPVAFGR